MIFLKSLISETLTDEVNIISVPLRNIGSIQESKYNKNKLFIFDKKDAKFTYIMILITSLGFENIEQLMVGSRKSVFGGNRIM